MLGSTSLKRIPTSVSQVRRRGLPARPHRQQTQAGGVEILSERSDHRLRQRFRHDHAAHRQHEPHAAWHDRPRFHYTDTLSKAFNEESRLRHGSRQSAIQRRDRRGDMNPTLPTKVQENRNTFPSSLSSPARNGGRGAVIVPDGVLFGSSNAHVETRKKLIEENRLDAVVSMPSGVFRPYAGVSTAVLILHQGRDDRPNLVLRHGA